MGELQFLRYFGLGFVVYDFRQKHRRGLKSFKFLKDGFKILLHFSLNRISQLELGLFAEICRGNFSHLDYFQLDEVLFLSRESKEILIIANFKSIMDK